jgi:dienelactone hydrolase
MQLNGLHLGMRHTMAVIVGVAVLSGCGAATTFPTADRQHPGSISGSVLRPSGPGPFPAVVILHGASGVQPHNLEWAKLLQDDDYVAIVVSSARALSGIPSVSTMAGDALGALAYLRSLPFVDGTRVGVMGASMGASAALEIMAGLMDAAQGANSFRAGVLLYPGGCSYRIKRTEAPLLILLGGLDGSPEPCQDMVRRLDAAGSPAATFIIYPGVHHVFDDSRAISPAGVLGQTAMYDGSATADARERVRTFFDEYLRRAK